MPEIKLTITAPKNLPSGKDFAQAIQKAAQKTAKLAQRDLESTVRTWDSKPDFEIETSESEGDYTVAAGTDDPVYNYVDQGTKQHVIRPKRSRYLRFYSGYRPKGKTGVIGSQSGGASGNPVFSTIAQHPGFSGRKFTILIAKRRQKTLEQEVSQVIAKVARTAE